MKTSSITPTSSAQTPPQHHDSHQVKVTDISVSINGEEPEGEEEHVEIPPPMEEIHTHQLPGQPPPSEENEVSALNVSI